MAISRDKTAHDSLFPHLLNRRHLLAGLGGSGFLAAMGLTARGQQATPSPAVRHSRCESSRFSARPPRLPRPRRLHSHRR